MESAPPPVDPAVDVKRRKWEAKQDATRPLGAWELYRALNDALDEGYELFDLSNREARFALILMGGLNAALVIAASQAGIGDRLSHVERQIEGGVISVYALFAIAFLLQAIQALRPGQFRPDLANWNEAHIPAGVRYYEDVVERTTATHWEAWQNVTLTQLNSELAVQLHSLSLKNKSRKVALKRLYGSLWVLTLLFSAILLLFAVFTLI